MRILHVVPYYFPAFRYGGPIQSVHGLSVATVLLGHEVHVYTTNIDGPGVSDVVIGKPVDYDGVSVSYFPVGLGRKMFRSPAMDRALNATVKDFDIVHIHGVWAWPTVVAASAARRWAVPYVLSPRGMLAKDLIRRRSTLLKKAWLALFDKRIVARSAAVHVTTDSEATDITSLGLRTKKFAMIPNGVNLRAEITAHRPSPTRLPYVLFLGRISWKKGLDRLVLSMAHVPDIELIIAGYDEDNYAARIKSIARECGVASRVRFIGPVEGDEKWALLSGAACLVLASYNENFGMVVVEAMSASCPVVVTAEVGLSAIVAETESGLVAAGDPVGLSTAINSLLEDPIRAREMGANGLRTARLRFDWNSVAVSMADLYDGCTAGPTVRSCDF